MANTVRATSPSMVLASAIPSKTPTVVSQQGLIPFVLLSANSIPEKCRYSILIHLVTGVRNPSSLNFVLPCYCPMIKPGNGIHSRLDGSILVGKYNCLNSLIHPRDAFDPLYERIRKSLSRGNQVTLTVLDGWGYTPHSMHILWSYQLRIEGTRFSFALNKWLQSFF